MEEGLVHSDDRGARLQALHESIRDCRLCALCSGRSQVVFGVGSPQARLMFVGEGPGFHEDRLGEPFVGQAGKLLTTLLGEIGLSRADVYIANVVKCRPPENRDPAPEEIEACSPQLLEQIAIIRPEVVCTLGRFAAKLLTGTDLSMTVIHGKARPMTIAGVDLVVFPVFHPAAALYTPANRAVLAEDFGKLRRLLDQGLPGGDQPAAAPPTACRPEEPGSREAPLPSAERPREATSEQLPLW